MFARVRDAPAADALVTVSAFLYLFRSNGYPGISSWRPDGEVEESPYEESDRETVLAHTESAEGAESAAIAAYWLDRRPEAFTVYRRTGTGETIAFFTWLRLTGPQDAEAADPVAGAAWAHVRRTAPVRPGEHVALTRFWVYPAAYQRPSPVLDLMTWRSLAEIMRSRRLAWTFFVLRDGDGWEQHMVGSGFHRVAEQPVVGARDYTLFAHDWRIQPAEVWLPPGGATAVPGGQAQPTDLVVLSRAEFDAAVRDALRALPRPGELAANPLNRSRLVADSGETLAQVLAETVDSLRAERDGERYHAALVATHLRRTGTQEAVARTLGLPFSTYRRHLARGVDLLCDALWHRELHGPEQPGPR